MILLYDEKWLQEFDGNIDPNTVNFKELANSLRLSRSLCKFLFFVD